MIEPLILVGGGIAIVGTVAWFHRARERKRREAYAEFSLIRGYTYEPRRAKGEGPFREAFEVFQKGRDDSWRNTITGTKNRAPFTAFEYVWHTGSGHSRHTHTVSGLIWEREDVSLPKFSLAPEGWFSRLGAWFGKRDIDFVESPEFSRAYQLKGADEHAVRQLFTADVRRFFEATPNQKVNASGRFLFWWFETALPPAERLDEWLEKGDQVRRRFFPS
jgi:hypothetical protein